MKKLIFIGGTMGVGKSTVGKLLQKRLPRCVFLDGDCCWDMSPFVVTEETKKMVQDNITHLLKNFIACSEFENIVFVWVMHEQSIIDGLLAQIGGGDYAFLNFSLVCSPEALTERLEKDIKCGLRAPDVIGRSVLRLPLYDKINSIKIDTGKLTPDRVADRLAEIIAE